MFEIEEPAGHTKINIEDIFEDIRLKTLKLRKNTKEQIRITLYEIGRDLQKTARELIDKQPKTGRTYRIKIGNTIVTHIASAAGEAPAVITGRLRQSINYKVIGGNILEFASYNVPYARYLEYADLVNQSGSGSNKIEPRPFLSAAFKKESARFKQRLNGALVKASTIK